MKHKKGFTLVEVIIALVIISIGILGVYQAIGAGRRGIDMTQSKVIAINLAREGVEEMFNIRDTNNIRRSSQKNECWMKRNSSTTNDSIGLPGDGSRDSKRCDDDLSMGFYSLSPTNTGDDINITPFDLNPSVGTFMIRYMGSYGTFNKYAKLNLSDGITAQDYGFSLCKESNSAKWFSCPLQDGGILNPLTDPNRKKNSTPYGQFFRAMTIKGLFDKQTGKQMFGCKYVDSNATDSTGAPLGNCGDDRPKELVFCSRVEYIKWGIGKEEICSSITNWQ